MDIRIVDEHNVSMVDCTNKDIILYARKSTQPLTCVAAFDGQRVQILAEGNTEEDAEKILMKIEQIIDDGYKKNKSGVVIQL